jgi:hypothetical protein
MMFTITKKAVRHSRQFRYLIVDVTKDTTTLYASDRDVFLFLVDDTNPIEAGRLRTDHLICISGGSIAGTAKWAARRLALRASIFARSA